MITNRVKKLLGLSQHPDSFLSKVSGVIHVGANSGQERDLYQSHGLKVIWIEPIPDVFDRLQANIQGCKDQTAYQALVTDADGRNYEFHVSNNDGLSSSILDLELHKDIWPEVGYSNTLQLKSTTLDSLLQRQQINANDYQALVMDTQGSELLVLKGAGSLLKKLQFIKTEVPDFESYKGCCQLAEIDAFMASHGFKEYGRLEFASRENGGSYFDITYQKQV